MAKAARTVSEPNPTCLDLGNQMWLMTVELDALVEQELNANQMTAAQNHQMVENMRSRGSVESVPYCAQPEGEDGPIEIISGHKRCRNARQVGFKSILALVDRHPMTRSEIIAKQLAHNALAGEDDPQILNLLLETIESPELLLATGLEKDVLPHEVAPPADLFTPRPDFRWKTISLIFLPHQMERLETLIDHFRGEQDLVIAALEDQWQRFLDAVEHVGRIKQILATGAVIDYLIEIALQHEEAEEVKDGAAAGDSESPATKRSDPTRVVRTIRASLFQQEDEETDSGTDETYPAIEETVSEGVESVDTPPENGGDG